MGTRNHHLVLAESQQYVVDSTNLCRALNNRVEHRLDIGRRPADDTEHLGRCRLMLQGLAQFCVAFLQFFKQPHVFNRDDGLISECGYKLYLLLREWLDSLSPDYDHPNGDTFPEHRNSEYGPETADFLRPGPLIIGVGQNIVNMNRPSLRYDTPGYRLSPWGKDRISLKEFFVLR